MEHLYLESVKELNERLSINNEELRGTSQDFGGLTTVRGERRPKLRNLLSFKRQATIKLNKNGSNEQQTCLKKCWLCRNKLNLFY